MTPKPERLFNPKILFRHGGSRHLHFDFVAFDLRAVQFGDDAVGVFGCNVRKQMPFVEMNDKTLLLTLRGAARIAFVISCILHSTLSLSGQNANSIS